jgi:hypothetical protein
MPSQPAPIKPPVDDHPQQAVTSKPWELLSCFPKEGVVPTLNITRRRDRRTPEGLAKLVSPTDSQEPNVSSQSAVQKHGVDLLLASSSALTAALDPYSKLTGAAAAAAAAQDARMHRDTPGV